MNQKRTPAAFYRGGTSNALFFRPADLPNDADERDRMLLHAMGSPDPYHRQLNGMGGGLSSVSKALWVEKSSRNDADIDYTFAQVAIDRPVVDYSANCGNMSASVAQFALEEGLISMPDGDATVRMFNTNTGVLVHSSFAVENGLPVIPGDFEVPGVPGSGSMVKLDFFDPARVTGRGLLPTGKAVDVMPVPGLGDVEVTITDATALVVFVAAERLGLNGTETPQQIEAQSEVMATLDHIRRAAAVEAGLSASMKDAPLASPRVAMVGPSKTFTAIDGRTHDAQTCDIVVRMISLETVHRAVMATGAMCLAATTMIDGTIPNRLSSHSNTDANEPMVRIGNPSGVTVAGATVAQEDGSWRAEKTTILRTSRRLMDGFVYHP